MLGESLGSHVRRLRLERAASRLKLTETPVVQVAFEAAYETHEAFSRAFRKAFGLSPVAVSHGATASGGGFKCPPACITCTESGPGVFAPRKLRIRP